jgi:hypothetical protein
VDGLALARAAAAAWAPQGNDVATNFPCGGTFCLARQKSAVSGSNRDCGVWCYDGIQQGKGLLTLGSSACLCPEVVPSASFGWY